MLFSSGKQSLRTITPHTWAALAGPLCVRITSFVTFRVRVLASEQRGWESGRGWEKLRKSRECSYHFQTPLDSLIPFRLIDTLETVEQWTSLILWQFGQNPTIGLVRLLCVRWPALCLGFTHRLVGLMKKFIMKLNESDASSSHIDKIDKSTRCVFGAANSFFGES